MSDFTQQGTKVIQDAVKRLQEAADKLGPPQIDFLNRRSALNMCAAVAVDAGQTLFGGSLRDAGIAVFQVASSQEDDEPRIYPFWVSPSLPELEKRKAVQERLDEIVSTDEIVRDFVTAMHWNRVYDKDVMPPSCYQTAAALCNFVRELLEWATLYKLAQNLQNATRIVDVGIQPVLLRDGTLRFDSMGEDHARRLRELFKSVDVPILGVTKQSALVRSAIIRLWLAQHNFYRCEGGVVVKLDFEDFKNLGWQLDRYFGEDGMRFGNYVLARFDRMPGSRNIFAVDVPDYMMPDWDNVLVILSGVGEHATATAYPTPGYPVALRKVHEKVALTPDRVRLLENTVRRSLGEEAYSMLKLLGM
ncbi:MAG TPA: hypothetical protein VFD70_28095 [Anaerolineae bacterium]|nr:hypothetical protein [Anaerolineae bacterium]